MLSWFRRKAYIERWKLVYQNCEAAGDGELRCRMVWSGVDVGPLDTIFEIANNFRLQLQSGQVLTSKQIGEALDANRTLRRYFDESMSGGQAGFDSAFRPFGGWDHWFEQRQTWISAKLLAFDEEVIC